MIVDGKWSRINKIAKSEKSYRLKNCCQITISESAKEDMKKLMNWCEKDWERNTEVIRC